MNDTPIAQIRVLLPLDSRRDIGDLSLVSLPQFWSWVFRSAVVLLGDVYNQVRVIPLE